MIENKKVILYLLVAAVLAASFYSPVSAQVAQPKTLEIHNPIIELLFPVFPRGACLSLEGSG